MKNLYALFCVLAAIAYPIIAQTPLSDISSLPNELHILAQGNGFGDEMIIVYREGATEGYDEMFDALKWLSPYENATEIYSILDDGTMLTINGLPPLMYDMISANIQFECGADTSYVLIFNNMESFDYGTEIWIKDKCTDSDWISITAENNVYTFLGSPTDAIDRFEVHFLGPMNTSPLVDNIEKIKIYSYNNNVFINDINLELLKEIFVYDFLGNEIYIKPLINNNSIRFQISNNPGYYFVKVVTENNIYSQKIFIGN